MNLNAKKESEFEERKKYVGLENFEVIAVNPTIKQFNELYGKDGSDADEEIEYVDEKDGEDRIKISVYMRGLQSNRIHREQFFIVDKERTSKDGGKGQYINQVCQSTWVDDEANLPEWFTKFTDKNKSVIGNKTYRRAKEGEADFYEFVRGVLRTVDFYQTDTEVEFNFKKMLKGDFSQLNSILTDSSYASPFTALNYIRTDKEDATKQYQQVFLKGILPRDFYNKVELATSEYYKERFEDIKENPDAVKIPGIPLVVQDIYGYVESPSSIKFKKDFENKAWMNFLKEVEGEYGCKGFYKICPVFEYDKAMDITAGNKTLNMNDSGY